MNEFKLICPNTNKEYNCFLPKNSKYIQKIFNSNKYGIWKVIARESRDNTNRCKYICVNIKTKTLKSITSTEINRGEVADYFYPNENHKGYTGNIKNASSHYLYDRWHQMLSRCNNKTHKSYSDYGGSGVSVCDEWHNFQNFIKDVEELSTFDKDLVKNGDLHLDKDSKQLHLNCKVYSRNNCLWISQSENNKAIFKEKVGRNYYFEAHKNEILFYHYNQTEFSNIIGLNVKSIQRCLKNKGNKTHKGFHFKEIDSMPEGWNDTNCSVKCEALKTEYENNNIYPINTNYRLLKVYNNHLTLYHFNQSKLVEILFGNKSANSNISDIIKHKTHTYKGFKGELINILPNGWTIENCTSKCKQIIEEHKQGR